MLEFKCALFYYCYILCSRLLICADWDDTSFEAVVTKNSGSSLEVFGHTKDGCVYLYPEEALYLIEMARRREYCINVIVEETFLHQYFCLPV